MSLSFKLIIQSLNCLFIAINKFALCTIALCIAFKILLLSPELTESLPEC